MGSRFMQPLRIAVQWVFLLFMLYLGICFYRFVLYCRGVSATFVPRPDGVEGFLPISALVSLRGWFLDGGINPVHPAGLVILLTVIAVSLILNRSFCSWICPVGTISECCWKGGFNLFRRNARPPRWVDIPLRGIKYLLLLFFLWSVFVAMPSDGVRAFIVSDYNKVADIRMLDFFLRPSILTIAVIAVLLLASVPLRNPFCRFLCPYGALLGLVALLSPFKVTRNREICVTCGVCTQVCPSRIPVMTLRRVRSNECIGCWRCISHCRASGALEMQLPGNGAAIPGVLFAVLVVAVFWGGTLAGKLTGHWRTAIPLREYIILSRYATVRHDDHGLQHGNVLSCEHVSAAHAARTTQGETNDENCCTSRGNGRYGDPRRMRAGFRVVPERHLRKQPESAAARFDHPE